MPVGVHSRLAGGQRKPLGWSRRRSALTPVYPPFYYPLTLGQSYRLTGRYAEAIAPDKRTASSNPNLPGAHADPGSYLQ